MGITKKQIILTIVSLLSAFLVSCDGGMGKKPEKNVIKEYVNTPKEKARDVAGTLERAQDKVHDQFEDLTEDE